MSPGMDLRSPRAFSPGRACARTAHACGRAVAIAACLGAIALSGCTSLRDDAQALMREGEYEKAADLYSQALTSGHRDSAVRAGMIQVREQALTDLLARAASARATGQLDAAQQLLDRARPFDAPGAPRVDGLRAELAVEQRQAAAQANAEKLIREKRPGQALRLVGDALKDNPRHAGLVALQRRLEGESRQAQLKANRVGLDERRPISLDFKDANLRSVLDIVTRHSGLNFVIDKDVRNDILVSMYLKDAKVEDVIDLITSTNQLAKKVLDRKTVLIYPNTTEKQRDHQEQVVKVFYLASAEAKGAAAFLKSMLKIRDPYVDERYNLVALRETAENIQLAERMMALYDTPEPEVLLELDVVEINSNKLNELGVQFPDAVGLKVLPAAGVTGLTGSTLRGIGADRVGVTIGDFMVNLKRQVGQANTLANPRIRVRSKEKAKILIGDKVPVITTTSSNTGFVSENVSYLDVGLKLDVDPVVYPDEEVAIKLALEVSSLAGQIKTASGTIAYQIGTRNASTLLRLRDGETQLLAGLISSEERSAAARLPGLGDLPVLGRLFSSQLDKAAKTELVLAITPHVIRNVRQPEAQESELWVGTETQPRLKSVGGRIDGAGALDAVETGSEVERSAQARTPAAAEPGTTAPEPPVLSWRVVHQSKEKLDLELNVHTAGAMYGSPLAILYPKDLLRPIEVKDGGFFASKGKTPTLLTQSIDAQAGVVSVGLLGKDSAPVDGDGTLLRISFAPLKAGGSGEVTLASFQPMSAGSAVPAAKLPVGIKVTTP